MSNIPCPKCNKSKAQRIGSLMTNPLTPIYGCAACGHDWSQVDAEPLFIVTDAQCIHERNEALRERNEARAVADQAKDTIEVLKEQRETLRDHLSRAWERTDEARARADRLQAECNKLAGETAQAWVLRDRMVKERDDARWQRDAAQRLLKEQIEGTASNMVSEQTGADFLKENMRAGHLIEVDILKSEISSLKWMLDHERAERAKAAQMWEAEVQHADRMVKRADEAEAALKAMKERPVETEFARLDGMWQQLVRERDEAQRELRRVQAYAEGPTWATHRESLVNIATRQREESARFLHKKLQEKKATATWVGADEMLQAPLVTDNE